MTNANRADVQANPVVEGRLMTVRQLSDYLRVPIGTIYRWSSEGSGPPSYKVGKHVRYSSFEVSQWLREVRMGS